MYSAGQFSKSSAARDKDKQANVSARKAEQKNRAKHRAEFEMTVGVNAHPAKLSPRPKPKVVHQSSSSHHSGSSISSTQQQQQQQQPKVSPSSRKRRYSSNNGTAYICLGLLSGFAIVIGALLMAFGFSSKEFSWTSGTLGMILAYAGIGTLCIGFLFISICCCVCCRDRRRKREREEEFYFQESGHLEKYNNNQLHQPRPQTQNRRPSGQHKPGSKDNVYRDHPKRNINNGRSPQNTSNARNKASDGRALPKTPTT